MRLRDLPEDVNAVSKDVLDAAIEVHRSLGPGLLESAYHACLRHELVLRGRDVESEVPIDVAYKGLVVRHAYQADLIVDGKVLIEMKAVKHLPEVAEAQTLTYLRWTGIRLGILLNFREHRLVDGFRRLVL